MAYEFGAIIAILYNVGSKIKKIKLIVRGKLKKKILIVDDEPGIIRLLSMRLKAKGYEVFEAFDGLEGVSVAIKKIPDLILMDIKMPNGGGIGAFERLIQIDTTKSIPVIFMTAFPTEEIKAKVLKMGAMDCISKPFISKDFELIIEKIIDGNDFNSENQNIDQYTYKHINN